jgi:hypothetical protein
LSQASPSSIPLGFSPTCARRSRRITRATGNNHKKYGNPETLFDAKTQRKGGGYSDKVPERASTATDYLERRQAGAVINGVLFHARHGAFFQLGMDHESTTPRFGKRKRPIVAPAALPRLIDGEGGVLPAILLSSTIKWNGVGFSPRRKRSTSAKLWNNPAAVRRSCLGPNSSPRKGRNVGHRGAESTSTRLWRSTRPQKSRVRRILVFSGGSMTEYERRKAVGDLGEALAGPLLVKAGFSDIIDLNQSKRNHAHVDFQARRNGKLYVINVKCRNRLQSDGRLNASFNFVKIKHQEKVLKQERAQEVVFAWLAIQVDPEEGVFSAYFGTWDDSGRNRLSIPMRPDATKDYETLADRIRDQRVKPCLSNRRKT